jgi:hypothetical protein
MPSARSLVLLSHFLKTVPKFNARFKVSILRGTLYRSEDIIYGEISGYDRPNPAVIFLYPILNRHISSCLLLHNAIFSGRWSHSVGNFCWAKVF